MESISGFGATGQSSMISRSSSFDLCADREDEYYDYLPMPDIDEDYLDSNTDHATSTQVQRRIPFNRIHQTPLSFDSHNRQCFMPGQKITVDIVTVDHSDHSQILNPNLYVVQIDHGEFKWTIRRRYKHFRSLHNHLLLYKTRLKLPVPTKESRERRKNMVRMDLTKFPKRPEPLVRNNNLEERRLLLQTYLQSVLRCPQYRNHSETLKFLEVSHLSFVNGLGDKFKEGMVEKRAGGRRISLHCCSCFECCQPGCWQERWLILKDTFVAYLRPNDGTISDVILMDKDFSVRYGLVNTGIKNGLLISNLSRHLLLKCWTQRKARKWFDEIQNAIKEKGQDYTQTNQYESFVPVRPNSYVNWFVDGASYMAAVADALDAAKEEIFITDWMLSPELHLKRPMLKSDRWRLDVILQRKAEEGVKIFILVYKEMEMALGINSFHTKNVLTNTHENIKVMRHPDGIKLWSHHEKCVVIDQRLAFLGGIDLCYGRWDTRKHRLTDLGARSLSNIFGNDDSETLQNIINNIPNIVPSSADHLLSPSTENNPQFPFHSKSSIIVCPSRLESIHEAVDLENVKVIVLNGDIGREVNESYDIVDDKKSNVRIKLKKDLSDVVNEDNSGGYSNLSCVVKDSPVNPESQSNQPSIFTYVKVSDSSVITKGIESSIVDDAGGLVVKRRESCGSSHHFQLIDEHEEMMIVKKDVKNSFLVDQEKNKQMSSSIQSINTLETFIKNISNRNEFEDHRKSSNKSLSINSITFPSQQKLHDNENDLSLSGKRMAFLNSGKSYSHQEHCNKDLVIKKKDEDVDDLMEKEIVKVFGMTKDGKPLTPKLKKNLKWKTVVDFKILFNRQISVDLANDDSIRPWNESVFHAKECDVVDGEIDARIGKSLKIWVGKDYCNFIFRDFVELDSPFTDMVDRTVTPRMPWHDIGVAVFGKPARDVARHFIQRWNFTKLQKRKTTVGIPMLLPKSSTKVPVPNWAIKSAFCCNCQILRSVSEWSAGIKLVENSIHNAYIDLILNAKHYIYIENQFFISLTSDDRVVKNQISTALYERIVEAHRIGETFRVFVILPLLPAFEGQLGTSTGTSIQAVIHWNYTSICRGGNSLLERLVKSGVNDPFEYISFYGLRKHEEMIGRLTTELVYVHSKLMIVDDDSVIIGSANINDRSLLGSRDSELAIVVRDTRSVDSLMNGETFKAGAFACSLRKSLFREHLGLKTNNSSSSSIDIVSDPVCNEFYKNVWMRQASVNTTVYEKVFSCIPTDAVMNLQQLNEYQQRPKLVDTNRENARKLLEKTRGHLVLMPLQFLSNEILTPSVNTKEGLAPTIVWT